MLSKRGAVSAASQNIPWRFAPGASNRYDKTSNPSGVISFGLAENALVEAELHKYIQENREVSIPSLALTYRFSTLGGPRFPIAMVAHMNELFHPKSPVKPEHILTAAGLTAIHAMIGLSLGDPGDGILVSAPVYGRFELDFGNTAGLKMVYANMGGVDSFALDMIDRYQETWDESAKRGGRIRALLIVNPHNPLGRCYPPATLEALMKFCQKNSIHLISDEVYALSVYDTTESSEGEAISFTSVLAIDTVNLIDPDLVHVLYGMSKDFAAAGLRLGCLVTQNSQLRKAVAANARFHSPSGFSIAIGTAILEDRVFVASFIDLCRLRLRESRAFVAGRLEEAGIQFDRRANAGFFLYVDLSPWLPKFDPNESGNSQEYALAQKLLDGGVGLHPCEEHGEAKGYFRLVFSQEQDVLAEGLRRLVAILGKRSEL